MILSSTETGQGPVIILLHGLFGAGKNLGVLARGLAGDYRIVSIDLRNHGASPHDPATDYPTQAADVAETMAALGVGHTVLIGHSMGGKVAMRLALDQPALVDALVVLDIAPHRHQHTDNAALDAMRNLSLTPGLTRGQADAAMAGEIADPGLRGFLLSNLILGDAPRWRLGLAEIAAGMDDILDWDERHMMSDKPALFVRGEGSDYVDDAGRAAIASWFPAADVVTIAGASHWLHAEKPDAVLKAITPFLRKVTAAKGSGT